MRLKNKGPTMNGKLKASCALIYGTLSCTALLIPSGLQDWAEDLRYRQLRRWTLPVAQSVSNFSSFLHVDKGYLTLRETFLKEEDSNQR